MAPGEIAEVLKTLRDFIVHRQVEERGPGRFVQMRGGIMVFFRDENARPLPMVLRGYPLRTPSGVGVLPLAEMEKHTMEQWKELAGALRQTMEGDTQ